MPLIATRSIDWKPTNELSSHSILFLSYAIFFLFFQSKRFVSIFVSFFFLLSLDFMFGCQIKTKCWLERYQVTCGSVRTMESTDKFVRHSNDAKSCAQIRREKYLSTRVSWRIKVRWIRERGSKFSCVSFPWRKSGWEMPSDGDVEDSSWKVELLGLVESSLSHLEFGRFRVLSDSKLWHTPALIFEQFQLNSPNNSNSNLQASNSPLDNSSSLSMISKHYQECIH